MSDEIKPVARINVTERRLEWEGDFVNWETGLTAKYPNIPLYTKSAIDQATEALRAKVKHYEEIESEMLLIGVERAKAQYQDEVDELEAMLREIVEAWDAGERFNYKEWIEKARGMIPNGD